MPPLLKPAPLLNRDAQVAKDIFADPANQGKLTSQIGGECIRHERIAIRLMIEDFNPVPGMSHAEYKTRILKMIDSRGK